MSDSEPVSGESSLSLFSGLGTSSVSGGSDIAGGIINVDELSESRLEELLEDSKSAFRQLALETLMFESYYERLTSGQVSFSSASSQSKTGSSRKGSGSGGGGGTDTSESESQPHTSRASLLDVSHRSHLSNRKRSGSRTSLGSRGKALRLSEEQKCGIATVEMSRIVSDLEAFHAKSQKQSHEGQASIGEMKLRLEELLNAKATLSKQIRKAQRRKSKRTDYVKLQECFKHETQAQKRLQRKLLTKTGVVSSQINHLNARLRQESSTAMETGPVNLEQLQLENEQCIKTLEHLNGQVISKRRLLNDTKTKRFKVREKIKKAQIRKLKLEQDIRNVETVLEGLKIQIPETEKRIECQKGDIYGIKHMLDTYKAPTTDDYFNLKLREFKCQEEQKCLDRKSYLKELEQKVQKQKKLSEKRTRAKSAVGPRRLPDELTVALTPKGRIIRGKTFNLEFQIPNQMEPRSRES